MNIFTYIKKHIDSVLVIFSGIVTGCAIYYILYWLIWIALVPFFFALKSATVKKSVFLGLLFGVSEGSVLLYWIIGTTQRYSGIPTLLGIPVFLVFLLYFSLYPALFAFVYSFFNKKNIKQVYKIFSAACLWIIIEWVNINILTGIPWVKYTLGFTQASSLYGIQLNSVTGQWGISFVIVIVNMMIVEAFINKKPKNALISIAVILCFYFAGFLMLNLNGPDEEREIKVAILQENVKAETRWQESNGDSLANVFFDLNRQAAETNPDLIVWSETALPWTFTPDDDLVRMSLEITKETNAGHIIGILSDAENNPGMVYNSVYYFEPDGRVTSRYDKMELLSFIEKPLLSPSLKIPFLSEGVHNNALEGRTTTLIKTPKALIGMLVCNESLLPYLSKKAVDKGAEVLVNISNDGWFEGTQLIEHHFYYGRMRAVETGRSIVVNSNRGYTGFIDNKGRIIKQAISNKAQCIDGLVGVKEDKTFYFLMGDWFVFVGIIFLLMTELVRRKWDKVPTKNGSK